MSTSVDTDSTDALLKRLVEEQERERRENKKLFEALEVEQRESDRLRRSLSGSGFSRYPTSSSSVTSSSNSPERRARHKSDITPREARAAAAKSLKKQVSRRKSDADQAAVHTAVTARSTKIEQRRKSAIDAREVKTAITKDLKTGTFTKRRQSRPKSDLNAREVQIAIEQRKNRIAIEQRKNKRPHPFIDKPEAQSPSRSLSKSSASVSKSPNPLHDASSDNGTKLSGIGIGSSKHKSSGHGLSAAERGRRSLNQFPQRAHPLEVLGELKTNTKTKKRIMPKTPTDRSGSKPMRSKSRSATQAAVEHQPTTQKTDRRQEEEPVAETVHLLAAMTTATAARRQIELASVSPPHSPGYAAGSESEAEPDIRREKPSLSRIPTASSATSQGSTASASPLAVASPRTPVRSFFDWKSAAAEDDSGDDTAPLESEHEIPVKSPWESTGDSEDSREAWEETIPEESICDEEDDVGRRQSVQTRSPLSHTGIVLSTDGSENEADLVRAPKLSVNS